jgi:hypothetical protein
MAQAVPQSKLLCEHGHPMRPGIRFCPICGTQRRLPGIVRNPVPLRVILALVAASFFLAFLQAGCGQDFKGPHNPTTSFSGLELIAGATHHLSSYNDKGPVDVHVPPQPWAAAALVFALAGFAATFIPLWWGAGVVAAASIAGLKSIQTLPAAVRSTMAPRDIYRQFETGWFLALFLFFTSMVLSVARVAVLGVRERRRMQAEALRDRPG